MVSDGPDEAGMTRGECLGNLEEADHGRRNIMVH
jgi:hypothetical protein